MVVSFNVDCVLGCTVPHWTSASCARTKWAPSALLNHAVVAIPVIGFSLTFADIYGFAVDQKRRTGPRDERSSQAPVRRALLMVAMVCSFVFSFVC